MHRLDLLINKMNQCPGSGCSVFSLSPQTVESEHRSVVLKLRFCLKNPPPYWEKSKIIRYALLNIYKNTTSQHYHSLAISYIWSREVTPTSICIFFYSDIRTALHRQPHKLHTQTTQLIKEHAHTLKNSLALIY